MSQDTDRLKLLEEIRQEHDELRDLLGVINKALSGKLESVARVAELLNSLRTHIDHHFAAEEETGFFNEVTETAPRLSEKVDQLKEEHARLRVAIKALVEYAENSAGDADWWTETEKRFREFSKTLMHHESTENSILLDAYDTDIGDKD